MECEEESKLNLDENTLFGLKKSHPISGKIKVHDVAVIVTLICCVLYYNSLHMLYTIMIL